MTATATDSFGTRFTVRIPAKMGQGSKGAALEELTADDAERIAIGLSEALRDADRRAKRPMRDYLMSDWVEIAKEPQAGTYTVTVVDQDVMARVRPYVDPIGPVSFREPMLAGYRLDGRKHYLHLNQHGQLIGSTTNGKSSLMQCAIAYATLCAMQRRDVVVWICGVQKLWDLVAGWVKPYLNLGLRCPIDWIANGPEDSLEMLAAAMRVGRYRQSIDMDERGGWPAILLILDEVSFLVEKHGRPIIFDGVPMFPDTMLCDIVRGVTSSDIYAMMATQHDVHAVFGDKGNTLQAQMAYSAMFKINDDSSHGRQLGRSNYKLKPPRHKGEYWIMDESTGMPVRLKSPYPQTIDKGKPVLHNGPTVADISWARRGMHNGTPHELDHNSAMAAGPAYQNRHTVVDDGYLRYLRGIAPGPVQITRSGFAEESLSAGEPDSVESAESDLATNLIALQRLGEEIPEEMVEFLADFQARHPEWSPDEAAQPVGQATASVLSLAGRQTMADRIEDAIRAAGHPLPRGAIIARLSEGGRRVNDNHVSNTLTAMVNQRRLRRDNGEYDVTEGKHTQAHTHTPYRGG